MLQLRSPLILGAVPVGLAVGTLAWLVLGGEKPVVGPVQAVEAGLNALSTPAHRTEATGPEAAEALVTPLFASASLAPVGPDVTVKVFGIARTPSGSSALVSINNGPIQWLAVGASKDGISMQEVTASGVVIETPGGTREVALGETSTPSPAAAGPAAPATPQGFRMPPAPASAPGMHR